MLIFLPYFDAECSGFRICQSGQLLHIELHVSASNSLYLIALSSQLQISAIPPTSTTNLIVNKCTILVLKMCIYKVKIKFKKNNKKVSHHEITEANATIIWFIQHLIRWCKYTYTRKGFDNRTGEKFLTSTKTGLCNKTWTLVKSQILRCSKSNDG